MTFSEEPVDEAAGAILAHSLRAGGLRLKKGTILDSEHVARLREAGVASVTVARLEDGDIGEDPAAAAVAAALVPAPEAAGLRLTEAKTGRVNLHATGPGVLVYEAERMHALNGIDPMLTFAVLPPFARVAEGTMVGTVKIISYGVAAASVEAAREAARGALRVAPPALRTATLIETEVPEGARSDKGEKAIAARLAALGIELAEVVRVPHETGAIAAAAAAAHGELVLILTASATSDPRDVAPEGVRRAGGSVERFGMPVDPGNLLFLGRLGTGPVIGLPGCARSPALNGADWVLERIACGLEVTGADIAAMGVGGLLKESPARGRPRES